MTVSACGPHATPAMAYWNQRHNLATMSQRLKMLGDAVGHVSDLTYVQWGQIFSMALEFKPDLIIELGRGSGNSTCIFTEVANLMGGREKCRVVSVCLSQTFAEETILNLFSNHLVNREWFKPLDCWIDDILAFDYAKVIGSSKRVLLFWDAHGFEIASCVLGSILPQIADRSHLVLMHDLSDQRYLPPSSKDYAGEGIWRGNHWEGPRVILGNIESAVEQAVSIVDFASRNGFEPLSADHSYHTEIKPFPEKMGELTRLLGDEFFSLSGHWFCFSLNGLTDRVTFPAFVKPAETLVDSPNEIISSLVFRTEASAGPVPEHGAYMHLKLMDVSNMPAVEALFGTQTYLYTPWNWASASIASYIKPGARVLDLASGQGNPYILDACRKYGVQLEMVDVLPLPPNLPPAASYTQWDLESGPPPMLGPYDCIVSISSIEHISEESRLRLLSWAKQVLAPGGVIAFSIGHLVGIEDFERVRHSLEHDPFFTRRYCQMYLPINVASLLKSLSIPAEVIYSGKIDAFPGMSGYSDEAWKHNDWLCKEEYSSTPELVNKPWLAVLSTVEIIIVVQKEV